MFPRRKAELPVVDPIFDAEIQAMAFGAQLANDTPKPPSHEQFDAFTFVEENANSLNLSSSLWNGVTNKAAGLKNPYIDQQITASFEESVALARPGARPPINLVRQAAKKTVNQMPTYTLLAARYDAANNITPRNSTYLKFNNGLFGQIASLKSFPLIILTPIHEGLVTEMRMADMTSQSVLKKLVQNLQPDDIHAMAELYQGGVASQDPKFSELQRIIKADWHHPDEKQSILRSHVASLAGNTDAYLNEFSQEVAENQNNQAYKIIRNMAKFAILASGGSKEFAQVDEIREVLSKTRAAWKEVDYLEQSFATFVESKQSNLEAAMSSIAGNKDTTSIRLHPTKKQLDTLRAQMEVQIKIKPNAGGNPNSKNRKVDIDVGKTGINQLPQVEKVSTAPEREPRSLFAIREIGKSKFRTVNLESKNLISEFKISQDRIYREDVTKMVSHLRSHTMSRAVKRLRKTEPIIIDGKPTVLWRFDPGAVPQLDIHPSNRYTRIVFTTIDDNKLVIKGIHTHEEFNKLYSSQQ